MEKNLEIEYKMLLTEEVFHQLMNDFTGHTYSQTNYYLTSIELGALRYSLRIREKEGYYEMSLKTPAANGRMEHNLEITKEDLVMIQNGQMPDNEITCLLKDKGFDLSLIKQSYSLTTIRRDVPFDSGMLSLDENHYNGITDYELEFEVNDEEAGLKQFKELCEIYHLQYKGNCASKIVRVLSTLKAGL